VFAKVFYAVAVSVILSGSALAGTDVRLTDSVYYPSYASYKTNLDLFLPASLEATNKELKNGNLTTAAKGFSTEIRQHPDDFAAYVGLLQSCRGVRNGLLPQYQTEERTSPTLINEFKLGLLTFYLYGEGLASGDPNSEKQRFLADISRKSLQKAYDLSHAAVIGFVLSDALSYTPGDSNVSAVFEDMLSRVAGSTPYQAYVSARTAHWNTNLPSFSSSNKKELLILARIVSNLRSQNSMTEGTVEETIVDGRKKIIFGPGTYTQEQQRAMSYLQSWQQQLLKEASSLNH